MRGLLIGRRGEYQKSAVGNAPYSTLCLKAQVGRSRGWGSVRSTDRGSFSANISHALKPRETGDERGVAKREEGCSEPRSGRARGKIASPS